MTPFWSPGPSSRTLPLRGTPLRSTPAYFISYNGANKDVARLVAMAFASMGHSVFFDEWTIDFGAPLTPRILSGLAATDTFVLLWSALASKSEWVEREIRTYLDRMKDDDSLRLVPVLLDDTPVSDELSDLKRLHYDDGDDPFALAMTLLGPKAPDDVDLAEALQRRLVELTEQNADPQDPLPFLVCPHCGSRELERRGALDEEHDSYYYMIDCKKCGWGDWSE